MQPDTGLYFLCQTLPAFFRITVPFIIQYVPSGILMSGCKMHDIYNIDDNLFMVNLGKEEE